MDRKQNSRIKWKLSKTLYTVSKVQIFTDFFFSFEIMKVKYVGLYLKGMSGKGKHLQF